MPQGWSVPLHNMRLTMTDYYDKQPESATPEENNVPGALTLPAPGQTAIVNTAAGAAGALAGWAISSLGKKACVPLFEPAGDCSHTFLSLSPPTCKAP